MDAKCVVVSSGPFLPKGEHCGVEDCLQNAIIQVITLYQRACVRCFLYSTEKVRAFSWGTISL